MPLSRFLNAWRAIDEFGGSYPGIDADSVPIFLDFLRETGQDELADEVERDDEFRKSLIDPSIPSIDDLRETEFPGRKQLGMNRFGYVMPQLFGTGKLCVGPMNCATGFDDWYEYATLSQAFTALDEWNGLGMPSTDGMTRRSGLKGTIIRVGRSTL